MDYQIFMSINGLAGRLALLDRLMILIAKYSLLLFVLYLVYVWFSARSNQFSRERRLAVIRAVLIAVAALLINQVIGYVWFRPRPFAVHRVNLLLERSPDPSFPSDHSTAATSLTIGMWSFGKGTQVFFALLTLITMFARVFVGTHYPGDVVGGAVTAVIGSFLLKWFWSVINPYTGKLLKRYEHAEDSLVKWLVLRSRWTGR